MTVDSEHIGFAVSAAGLGDGQGAGPDVEQEGGVAAGVAPGLSGAVRVQEGGIGGDVGVTDGDGGLHGDVLLGIHDVRRAGGIVAVGQLRSGAGHGYGGILGGAVEPAGGGAVAGKRGPIEGVAVVDGAVLVGERWFKDVDLAGGAARLLAGRCAAGIRLRLRFGGYRDGDGVGGVLPQLSQVSDGGAVRACEGDGDIHVGGLPRLQAVGVVGVGGLGQIQLNAAYLYGGAALQLAGSETAQQIDVIVLRCNGDGLDGDVYRGLQQTCTPSFPSDV